MYSQQYLTIEESRAISYELKTHEVHIYDESSSKSLHNVKERNIFVKNKYLKSDKYKLLTDLSNYKTGKSLPNTFICI
ncbi:hypothetical protein CBC_A0213 [Clostridium botulinum C str. Eklund]|nr:hypothetical protein CBC_A0213 [Clostridium botulinum C str. Eklund]NEZ49687.1 hypothetical protein [Clostridium botulinum]